MSATDSREGGAPDASPEDSGPEAAALDDLSAHQYFRAIEDLFIELRGAPLMLSPADWQVARAWHDGGVPLALVEETLRRLFSQRAERGSEEPVQSLRYCARAVAGAWRRQQELSAVAIVEPVPGLDLKSRLAALARSLPASLPEREAWVDAITSLEGSPESVERQLAAIDGRLLSVVEARLAEDQRARLLAARDRAVGRLRERLDGAVAEAGGGRVLADLVRESAGLPVLSLFAVEPTDD